MTALSFSSLRGRLLALVLFAILPGFALTLYAAVEQRHAATADVQDTALRLARLAASDHGRWIAGARQLLVGLALLPSVRERNGPACSRSFADILRRYPLYANLGAAAPDGRVFCSAIPLEFQVHIADRQYFRLAMTSRDFAVGEYQIGRVTGKSTVNVGFPVRDDTGTLAVVFAAIDLGELHRFLEEAKLPEGSTLTVVDQSGTVLVHHPDHERWVGRNIRAAPLFASIAAERLGVTEANGIDDVPRLFGFSPLLGTPASGDVYVSIGIPQSSAVAEANWALVRNLAALALVTVLALAAAWAGSSALVLRQVDALVTATTRIAAGDLTARTRVGRGAGELDQLARAFDEMAETLQGDIAERQRTEQELQHQREALYRSEKMADLGRLAAGVAHELKNPLAVVAGRVGLLEMQTKQGKLSPADVLSNHVASMKEAVGRMTKIMRGLSTYAKPAKPERTLLDLRELLSAVQDLVAHPARSGNVTIRIEAPRELPAVLGDRSQLMQVFLNLTTNAIEAMGGTGGRLALRVRVEEGASAGRGAETEGPTSAGTVRVEVADTGPGILADDLAKIWEPFYTTKPEGTGLGLSIVRSLVEEQPGATITVESAPGQGTTFMLTMPVAGGTVPGP